MGKEIERKFLVQHDKWAKIDKPEGQVYRQGYLVAEPDKTIRVRQTSEKGFITIKGITTGATRPEYEYEIPLHEAKELLDQFAIAELSKIRYSIDVLLLPSNDINNRSYWRGWFGFSRNEQPKGIPRLYYGIN